MTATLSVLYIRSTFSEKQAPVDAKSAEKVVVQKKLTTRRVLTLLLLVLLHVDILFTGYLRIWFREGLTLMRA